MGYYETYELEYTGDARISAGLGDDLMVTMGMIRDYSLSQATQLSALIGLTSVAALLITF